MIVESRQTTKANREKDSFTGSQLLLFRCRTLYFCGFLIEASSKRKICSLSINVDSCICLRDKVESQMTAKNERLTLTNYALDKQASSTFIIFTDLFRVVSHLLER